jgi:hypothetical protein
MAHFDGEPVQLEQINPEQVAAFMARYTAGKSPGTVKATGISLRSYFRYRAILGEQTAILIAVLPRVAQWRLAGLPSVLSEEEIN